MQRTAPVLRAHLEEEEEVAAEGQRMPASDFELGEQKVATCCDGIVVKLSGNYCMFLNSVCEVPICFHQDFHFVYKSCVEQNIFQK